MKNIFIPLASVALLSSCATAVDYQTQNMTIRTPGAENAKCHVQNEAMKYTIYTDETVEIMKSPHDLVVSCMAPGNRQQTVHVKREVNDWVIANVANGFVPGAAYDYFSRGAFEYPETITVSFVGMPVREYPLPDYMSDDLKDNHKYGRVEYMGPDTVITEKNKLNKPVVLEEKENPYGLFDDDDTSANTGGSSMALDRIHSQYNPAVSYDPTEEDK